jgi:hypothetical protein
MEEQVCESWFCKIYMAGDINVAKQICREYCTDNGGACINIYETDYIYTGGEEVGFCVEFINYPRFPEKYLAEIYNKSYQLASLLMNKCCQASFTIMNPNQTHFYSRKKDIGK